mgnify:FL=1
MKTEKILCVVVTYNRLAHLKECLAALSAQSCKNFDILIVNNGSTDGTREFLQMLVSKYIVINQDNVGGAGGFYTGMKYMLDNKYDYLWMMDDDGVPDECQLEQLLKYKDVSWYLNALVLDKDDNQKLAFPLQNTKLSLQQIIQKGEIITNFVHPFNGTFLNVELLKKIGLIKKEMFIWGDEKEYTLRAIKIANVVPTTIAAAIHYHPKEKGDKENAFPFGWFPNDKIIVKPESLSCFYYRNLGYIDATYFSRLKSAKWIFCHIIYFLRKNKITELEKYLVNYFAGRNNNYK